VDFTICCSFCSIHMDVLCWDEKCCEKLFDSFTVRIQASSHSVIIYSLLENSIHCAEAKKASECSTYSVMF